LVGKYPPPHGNGALVVDGFASFWFRVEPSGSNAIVGGGRHEEQNRHHHAAAGESRLDLNTNSIGRIEASFEGAVADEEKEQLDASETQEHINQ
jgi:hypothetical protein